ncbi:hypothetical protein [Aurantiacibacter xanthus]|uniref:hypothetical protein n=1 Tax=Aurantiacibacter xanthus TaxID=1784712 RepID=UPI0017498021|nr:hypothetical protein [Aurantiacibacter xanthus]
MTKSKKPVLPQRAGSFVRQKNGTLKDNSPAVLADAATASEAAKPQTDTHSEEEGK